MNLRSGKIRLKEEEKKEQKQQCNHDKCSLLTKTTLCCCYCADKRPQNIQYYAFTGSYLRDVKKIPRSYHYCPSCKNMSASVEPPQVARPPPVARPTMTQTIEIMKQTIECLKAENADLRTLISHLEKKCVN
jgi:hypothetical protein